MDSSNRNLILIGGGGHCKSCIEAIESEGKFNIVGILDVPKVMGKEVLGYRVVGNDGDYAKFRDMGCAFLISAGQIKSPGLRRRIYAVLKELNADIATVIAGSAIVSEHAVIHKGTVVMHNAVINAGAEIGVNCIINTGAIIEHDVKIGDNTHISTSAVINGDCKIGNETFVGSNSCISSGVNVGNNIIIGAGTTVTKTLVEQGTYVGSPARKI